MTTNQNGDDFVDRKIDGLVKIFGLAQRDFMALMLVLSLIGNIVLVYQLGEVRTEMTNMVIQEVRRQVPQETSKQLQPIKNSVDTTMKQIQEHINFNDN